MVLRFLLCRPSDPLVITAVLTAALTGLIPPSSSFKCGLTPNRGASDSDRVRNGMIRSSPSLLGKLATVGDGSAAVVAPLADSSAARKRADSQGNGGVSQVA